VELSLSGVPIPELCARIRKGNRNVKIIGLKVPFNYCMKNLVEMAQSNSASVCSYNFGKHMLIVLDFKRGADWLQCVHKDIIDVLPAYVRPCVFHSKSRVEPGGGKFRSRLRMSKKGNRKVGV